MLIDPYPGLSFMALAERASYESPDDKAKEPSLPQDFIQNLTT